MNGSYMLIPRYLILKSIRKRQLIQSQVARTTFFIFEFRFFFDMRNDESYLPLKGTGMQIEKLNRRNQCNSNNKCKKTRIHFIYGSGVILFIAIIS